MHTKVSEERICIAAYSQGKKDTYLFINREFDKSCKTIDSHSHPKDMDEATNQEFYRVATLVEEKCADSTPTKSTNTSNND